MIRDLIIKNRSYRRFDSGVKISREQVENWVELARYSPSGRNMQPLKYLICTDEEINKKIFPNLGWAGYLTDWAGPEEGERPAAYIVVMLDKDLSDSCYCDDGIAMQSILLGASEDNFGGCIIGTVNKSQLSDILAIPTNFQILWVIALGKPKETVVLDNAIDGEIRYWRDSESVHHVPKRPLSEIIYKSV
jgi:nitroreductase